MEWQQLEEWQKQWVKTFHRAWALLFNMEAEKQGDQTFAPFSHR